MIFDGENIEATNTDYHGVKEIITRYLENGIQRIYLLGDGVMSSIVQMVLQENNIYFEILSRKNGKLEQSSDILAGLNSDNLIINCCSREYCFSIPENSSFYFWDMNYSLVSHESLFKNSSIRYCDGMELLKLQAKYALSFWNLKTP